MRVNCVSKTVSTGNKFSSWLSGSLRVVSESGTLHEPSTRTKYVYDRFGNRWQQNGPNSFLATFTGNNPSSPQNNNRMDGYSYDAAGNLLNDGNHTYFYDAENRLTQVDGSAAYCSTGTGTAATACYTYDAKGYRIRSTGTAGCDGIGGINGGMEYVYDLSGRWIVDVNSSEGGGNSGSACNFEVYAGSRHLVSYWNGDTFLDHSDWLGTERAKESYTYRNNLSPTRTCTGLPFGDALNCTAGYDPATPNFTGKPRDSESGLDNFGARYFGSSMGRFMSPDEPFADQHPGDPQSWNLYAYARNNPTNHTDEDGRTCTKDKDGNFTGDTCDLGTGTGNTPDKINVTAQSDNSTWGDMKALGLNAGIGLLNAPGDYFAMLTGLRATPEIPTGQGTAAALGAFLGPFLFPDVEIGEVVKSAEALGKGGQMSRGAQSIAKKLGRALREGYKSAFQGSPVTTEKAAALVRDIMSNPARVNNLGKYTEIYNAAGQGVRLEKGTNNFVTFVEGSKAKP